MSSKSLAESVASSVIKLIKNFKDDPNIILFSRRITSELYSYRKGKEYRLYSELSECFALYYFVYSKVRYVRDPYKKEIIFTPLLLLQQLEKYGKAFGDCDDQTALLGALLASLGYAVRCQLVGIERFSHIYPEVFIPSLSRWFVVDPIAKDSEVRDFLERIRLKKTFYLE